MNDSTTRTHIQIIAWINIVLGIPGVLFGIALAAGLTAFFAHVFPPIAPYVSIIGLLIAVCAGFGVFVGIGLLHYAPWARIAAIIASILHLFAVHTAGVATLFGIYSLVMLFQPETERLFERRTPSRI